MKDLFSGSFGRLNNHGGSHMYTTPHTVYVPPEYEVATDVPSVAEFVTCSLDGRLWVWKRSRRYYVAVFRWNEDSQKLVFAGTTIYNNLNIVGRGIDWLLTDNMIIQALNDEPYVASANLFAGNATSFLYSALRSKDFASGFDPFTNSAWGLSDDNGNSEGYGYFNRSALLQSVNKHYSLLPTIEDNSNEELDSKCILWNIIGNFLLRRQDNPLTEAHNSMLNIRPLIPLEFNGSNPAYGAGFNNDISLTCYNGELWGRGLYHFGRCYILPAVFDENGTPQEFYLYISPDYPVSPYKSKSSAVTEDDWLNMGILHTDSNLYGFLHEQADSLDYGLCYSSDTPKIFDPAQNEWVQLADDGSMVIDTYDNSGLVLNDNGAVFLNGDNPSYKCKGLKQWLTPAGNVDAVSLDYVISSGDNVTVATHIQQGFYREALQAKSHPISARAYDGKKLSFSVVDKNIHLNTLKGIDTVNSIAWLDIYRAAIEARCLNIFERDFDSVMDCPFPIFIEQNISTGDSLIVAWGKSLGLENSAQMAWYIAAYAPFGSHYYEPAGTDYTLYPGYTWGTYPGRDAWGNDVWTFPAFNYSDVQKLFYIHPISGQPIVFYEGHFFDDGEFRAYMSNDLQTRASWGQSRDYPDFDVPTGITCHDDQIVYVYDHYSENCTKRDTLFKPICPIPEEILDWQNTSHTNPSMISVEIPDELPSNASYSALSIFSEKYSQANFLCDIPSVYHHHEDGASTGDWKSLSELSIESYSFGNIHSIDTQDNYYNQGLHVAIANHNHFAVFTSEIHPEIFDFYAEAERSKLS